MISKWRPAERLGFRLAFLLAIALLPLGVISAMQAQALLDQTRARSEAALLGATRLASSGELRATQRAQGAAEAMAKIMPDVMQNRELCMSIMTELVEQSGTFSFAAFIDTEGTATCTSTGEQVEFGRTESIEAMLSNAVPGVIMSRNPRFSDGSVMIARHPVRTDAGDLIGFTTISVPHSTLMPAGDPDESDRMPLMLLTFNGSGDVITSSVGFEQFDAQLPRDRSLAAFVGSDAFAFTAVSNDGEERTYSVVPLVPGGLYALGAWPLDTLPGNMSLAALPPVAVPALMWLVSLGVALIAAERLVTRHIKKLTGAITRFARGDRMVGNLDFTEAPEEIRAAGDAFETMTSSILHDEAELENTLHQKEVLLREVHHRVKNNLQLIASIMNMQARRAHTPEAKVMVRRLQDRVMSLATIHRGLYQTSGLADVRADELLQDITRQIVNMGTGPGHSFQVEQSMAPLRLTPDQAVPLALLVTEALTNALKYAGGQDDRATLRVSLTTDDPEEAVLVVENSRSGTGGPAPGTVDGEATGLGTHLVKAFVQQLDGTEEREMTDRMYRLTVRFPIRPLAGGEERQAVREAIGTDRAAE